MATRWVNQKWHETLRDGTSPGVETKWQLTGDTVDRNYSILQARLDLLATIPSAISNLPLTELEIERQNATGFFEATANYGMRQIPEDGKFDFTMDSRPESRRIYLAPGTTTTYAPPGRTAPAQGGAVNVSSELVPVGRDIFVPVKTFNVSVWWSTTRFVGSQPLTIYQSLQNYIDLMDLLEGTVNSSYFSFTARGLVFKFQTGECLFAGSRLSQQGSDLWQIDLEFRKKKSYIDPLLSSWVGSPTVVEGWDDTDFPTEVVADPAAKKLGVDPFAGYVHRQYFRSDLNQLHVPVP